MTAVTDQDHTDHIDHMGRRERGSETDHSGRRERGSDIDHMGRMEQGGDRGPGRPAQLAEHLGPGLTGPGEQADGSRGPRVEAAGAGDGVGTGDNVQRVRHARARDVTDEGADSGPGVRVSESRGDESLGADAEHAHERHARVGDEGPTRADGKLAREDERHACVRGEKPLRAGDEQHVPVPDGSVHQGWPERGLSGDAGMSARLHTPKPRNTEDTQKPPQAEDALALRPFEDTRKARPADNVLRSRSLEDLLRDLPAEDELRFRPRPDSLMGTPRPDSLTGAPRPDSLTGTPRPDSLTGTPRPDSLGVTTSPPEHLTGTPSPEGSTGMPVPDDLTRAPRPVEDASSPVPVEDGWTRGAVEDARKPGPVEEAPAADAVEDPLVPGKPVELLKPRLTEDAPQPRLVEEVMKPRPVEEVPESRPVEDVLRSRSVDDVPRLLPAEGAPEPRPDEDAGEPGRAEDTRKPGPVEEAPAAGAVEDPLVPGKPVELLKRRPTGDVPESHLTEDAQKSRPTEDTHKSRPTEDASMSRPAETAPKARPANEAPKARSAEEPSKSRPAEAAPKSRAEASPKPRAVEESPTSRAAEESPKTRPAEEASKARPSEDVAKSRSGDGEANEVDPESAESWDDGLIARRMTEAAAAALAAERTTALEAPNRGAGSHNPAPLAYDGSLRSRLDALRELVGLSRTRLESRTLAEAGRVLDEAAARRKLSGKHTVVAIAGATGSGKSQLFNSLAGVAISETGVRRPTTAAPIACSWSDGAAGLIDRLGIPGRLRRRPLQSPEAEAQLRGLVLIDLPDHDSAAVQHREQVDRILKLVDAVIWVVDPEKYADAVLHERYLRPMAGHAEVMFVVLNQVDRLPGEAADQVLDDLRRLLDEDGVALGEFGEPGATVLALSALTGDGVADLREALGEFVAERGAAARRVGADLDAAAAELQPVYATGRRVGLSEEAREEFAARLADAVGATAAGEAAERAWLRNANRACGTPWLRLWRWYQGRGERPTGRIAVRTQADEEATARQRVEQAVRTVADRASAGLPAPWALAVREAAVRGSHGLSEALDELAARAGLPPGRPPRPSWWPMAVLVQASMTLLQIVGGAWLAGQIAGVMAPNLGVPVLLMICGIVGGPLVEWGCRMAARGPARRYGQDAERRLREAAGSCGRARVLDPLAAELLRYREVREQYGRVVRSGAGVG